MKENKRFKIDIYGLKIGVHEYEFEINDELFESFEDSLVDNGKGECKVSLLKKETLMELTFDINASLELICDRSNEPFDYVIDSTETLLIKYGEEFDDSEEDIWVIPSGQQSINIQQPLYEYISLAVPMKKLHPKFEEDDIEEDDELEWVYTVGESEEEEEESKEEDIDPRWAALKNIKKN
ncbi:YceD family protein [Reichenbachiella versicolor]|uniref:YceD family protein n=1 Tax=Reichenbachiella versicolor TaxID=1821036 RepID=UPI000D6DE2E4|nr:DUF177 domain-containing protein [Reichenbachiella versicolor]